MKKSYIAPAMEFTHIDSNIICVSAKFGNGTTDIMYGAEREDWEEEEEE